MKDRLSGNFTTNVAYFKNESGDKILYPFSPPIFQSIVDENFTKSLIEEGRRLQKDKDDWNPRLAGNLKYGRSLHYKSDFVDRAEKYLLKYVERFFDGIYQQFGSDYQGISQLLEVVDSKVKNSTKQGKLQLDTLWINFSQKHDFNPPHTHSGALSFVIYCKVPKKIFENQSESNNQHAGEIVFHHNTNLSTLDGYDYPVRPFENLIFIFPSKLKHYVPAYWVDEERISVSGNFRVV